MPKTKRKPRRTPSVLANGPTPEVLTLSEAAAYLRLPKTDVLRLVHEQGLPARQAGPEWRFLLTAIRDWLSRGTGKPSNKDAWMRLVGVWKDDPFFEHFLREINKERNLLNAEVQE
ncbi:MAG TPA: helix-turn-helix domain-containing protein [Gemmataceae bacterium]|nr:helix-turn-helix domain-containing protein [Gemmataceae bacterium]